MKVAGIIAEFNPFHNGHKYIIEEARKITGADYVVVIMSGNFVQRGTPAVIDKYSRTQMALNNGADLVLELPILFATASAEDFARGGVGILSALGCVSDLVFGGEVKKPSDIELLSTAATILANETAAYKTEVRKLLDNKLPFPKARILALKAVMDIDEAGLELLASPNNILAMEYMKAIRYFGSTIQPHIISRLGAGYHDSDTSKAFASATGIRKAIETDSLTDVLRTLPSDVYDKLLSLINNRQYVFEDDFSDMLYQALSMSDSQASDISQRIYANLENYENWSQFAGLIKHKNITLTAVNRFLCRSMLGINNDENDKNRKYYQPYAKILGFRKNSSALLSFFNENSAIPVLMKLATDKNKLDEDAIQTLASDIKASDMYNYIVYKKSEIKIMSDYRHKLVIQ